MSPRILRSLALIAILSFCTTALLASGPEPLTIGSAAPEFKLPGVDGKLHSLHEYDKAKILVLVFTANHCPTAQAYEARIQQLYNDYKGRGVALVAIGANDPLAVRLDEQDYSDLGDTLADMKQRVNDRHITYPYLYDGETQAMARQYGPAATPHAFVFDSARKLRFVGRIDDNENPAKVTVSDTRNAIEALLAGKPVPVETTKVFGCSIKWSEKRAGVKQGFEQWAAEPVALDPIDLAGVKALLKNDSGKLRLINLWATWCGPCTVEFPELVSINRIYRIREFEVVTINMDTADRTPKVKAFLDKQQASMKNLQYPESPYSLIDTVDPKWQGALPYTLLVAPGGKVIYRNQGGLDVPALRKAIIGWMGNTYFATPGEGMK